MPDLPQLVKSAGAVLDSLRNRFGGPFDFNEVAVVVGVARTQLVGGNAERTSIAFCNFGAADVVIAPNQGVTTSRGLRVSAGGGIVALSEQEDHILPILEWWGISTGAANTVYVLSTIRFKAGKLEEGYP